MIWPTPNFWYEKPGLLARLLQPFSLLYGFFSKPLGRIAAPIKLPVPVICIGNVTAGGSGKTPVTADIAKKLQDLGAMPHIISHGYGGHLLGPVRVDPREHSVGQVGDEPLLLARIAPTWVAKKKIEGMEAAIQAGASILLLDDGLQNHTVAKDFSFLVIDGLRGLGNGMLLPAGPLRENLEAGLAKAGAVILIGEDRTGLRLFLQKDRPLLDATTCTFAVTGDLRGKLVYAFCGLGHAAKFYEGLRAAGAQVKGARDFPDHYMWSTYEMEQILAAAEALKALPVTTLKDSVRVPESFLPRILLCNVELHWRDEASLIRILKKLSSK